MNEMTMEINEKAKKLRIYVSNTDRYKHEPLYQYLARTARELGMAGATIYKGVMGYGTSSDFVPPSFWEFTEKVPVTVEIIDSDAQIQDYLATIKPMLEEQPKGCLITMQDVDIVFIKHGDK
jgi:PII-like signaling protein